MTLDLADDAVVFLADFAETVIYRPVGRRPRTIHAVVQRQPPEALADAPSGKAAWFTVEARNDERDGIPARLLDTGGDRLDVADREGGTPRTRRITLLESQDAGMVRVRVQG